MLRASNSDSSRDASSGKRVVWDERNLMENAEYQRLHPVTMHIDEPKTPYVYGDDLSDEEAEDGKWDPVVNQYAKEVKERVLSQGTSTVVAPVGSGGRPMLAPGSTTGELENERAEMEFKKIRKAVYADEGAAFKAMLAKKQECEDDEDEDEDDDEDGENDDGDNSENSGDNSGSSGESDVDGGSAMDYESDVDSGFDY